jgi:hypothetical protein
LSSSSWNSVNAECHELGHVSLSLTVSRHFLSCLLPLLSVCLWCVLQTSPPALQFGILVCCVNVVLGIRNLSLSGKVWENLRLSGGRYQKHLRLSGRYEKSWIHRPIGWYQKSWSGSWPEWKVLKIYARRECLYLKNLFGFEKPVVMLVGRPSGSQYWKSSWTLWGIQNLELVGWRTCKHEGIKYLELIGWVEGSEILEHVGWLGGIGKTWTSRQTNGSYWNPKP